MAEPTSKTSERVPPQSPEAEAAVLGSMLLEKEAIPRAIELLTKDAFYVGANARIFQVITEMFQRNQAVDLVTLKSELEKRKELEEVGGVTYLSSLLDSVATAAHVEYYANIVLEKYVLRSLITAASEIAAESYDGADDVEQILERAEERIFKISEARLRGGFVALKSILKSTFESIEKFYDSKKSILGLPTGFKILDQKLSGLQKSDLIIVAGRPAMGKTSFCLNIAHNAAVEHKIPVAIFSLEMSKDQLVQRMLCTAARVSAHKLRTGMLAKEDWSRLTTAAGQLANAPIYIDDTPAISILEMRAKARRIKAEAGIGLIIVDYLQLMQAPYRIENRQQEISLISRSLKTMAKELDVPVIALSQLSRAVESRQHRRPQLSDLRESGAIEQDADVVLFIYREEFYDKDTDKKGLAEIIIGKQRNGPTDTLELVFQKDYTRFADLEPFREYEEEYF